MIEELYILLFDFFQDEAKVEAWLHTENPLLGNVTPYYYIYTGQAKKIYDFVVAQLESEREL